MIVIQKRHTFRFKKLSLLIWPPKGKARREASVLKDYAMAGHAACHAGAGMHGKSNKASFSGLPYQGGHLTVGDHTSHGDLAHDIIYTLKESFGCHGSPLG